MTNDVDKQVKVMTIIAAAFMASVVVYVVVAFLVTNQPATEPVSLAPTIPPAMIGLGVASAAAGFFVRRFLLERAGPRELQRYFTALIVGLALFEAAAIYGLVATFLSRDVKWAGIAALISLTCMALTFPRRDAVEAYLQAGARVR